MAATGETKTMDGDDVRRMLCGRAQDAGLTLLEEVAFDDRKTGWILGHRDTDVGMLVMVLHPAGFSAYLFTPVDPETKIRSLYRKDREEYLKSYVPYARADEVTEAIEMFTGAYRDLSDEAKLRKERETSLDGLDQGKRNVAVMATSRIALVLSEIRSLPPEAVDKRLQEVEDLVGFLEVYAGPEVAGPARRDVEDIRRVMREKDPSFRATARGAAA